LTRRRRRRRREATRKTSITIRRRPMVRHTLVRNGNPIMSSDYDSDGVATVAIKGSSSSLSKSLFPNLNKGNHTCLMIKESKRKVKSKSSPPKNVSSDDELDLSDGEDEDEEALLEVMSKNPKANIKGLLSEVGIRDELLDQQEKLLVQEKKSNQETKKLLNLEKEKMISLTKNFNGAI
jgi:hypothetical protein